MEIILGKTKISFDSMEFYFKKTILGKIEMYMGVHNDKDCLVHKFPATTISIDQVSIDDYIYVFVTEPDNELGVRLVWYNFYQKNSKHYDTYEHLPNVEAYIHESDWIFGSSVDKIGHGVYLIHDAISSHKEPTETIISGYSKQHERYRFADVYPKLKPREDSILVSEEFRNPFDNLEIYDRITYGFNPQTGTITTPVYSMRDACFFTESRDHSYSIIGEKVNGFNFTRFKQAPFTAATMYQEPGFFDFVKQPTEKFVKELISRTQQSSSDEEK